MNCQCEWDDDNQVVTQLCGAHSQYMRDNAHLYLDRGQEKQAYVEGYADGIIAQLNVKGNAEEAWRKRNV